MRLVCRHDCEQWPVSEPQIVLLICAAVGIAAIMALVAAFKE